MNGNINTDNTSQKLMSDECLQALSEEFCCLECEVSCLIKLLWNIRSFKQDIGERSPLFRVGEEIDQRISLILSQSIDLSKCA